MTNAILLMLLVVTAKSLCNIVESFYYSCIFVGNHISSVIINLRIYFAEKVNQIIEV